MQKSGADTVLLLSVQFFLCKYKRQIQKTIGTKHVFQPEKGGRKPGSPEFAGVCRSIPRSILAPEHLAKTLARVENRSQLVK